MHRTHQQSTPNVGPIISRRKPGVLGDLTDGLKDIGRAKSKRKERHDAAIEETHGMEIRVKAEVEKKRFDIERELGGLEACIGRKTTGLSGENGA